GDVDVEVRICRAEHDPDRSCEAVCFGYHPAPGPYRAQQVVVEPPEGRAGRAELLVEARDQFGPDVGVADEPAHLPGVEPPVEARGAAHDGAGEVAQQGGGVQEYRLGPP